MTLPFVLPPVTEGSAIPLWEGNGFRVGHELINVLQYSINTLGWNDDLTLFHEESAGDQHFIDRASRDHAMSQLKNNLKHDSYPVILEVGCSSGFMLQRMQKAFPEAIIVGSDVVVEPLKKLSERFPNIPLLRFDMLHCPLPDNSVDAVVMLNVLEHIKEDGKALQQAYRILKPDGILVIEVPAGPNLYDAYDKVLMHYRRYVLSQLCQLVKEQHFEILKESHLGFFLYPGFWLVKQRNKRLLTESVAIQHQQVDKAIRQTGKSKLMHAIMQTELRLGRYVKYPRGIRCLVTARKK